MIRKALPTDAGQIADIYNHYIRTTVITFEEVPVTEEEMKQRIVQVTPVYPWFVYEEEGDIIGYCYATRWKERAAYRHSVEATVYLRPLSIGKGIGKQLYAALIDALKLQDIHAVIGGAALPNDASIRLHESLGFQKAGQFKEVGFKFGRWVDVGYWELILG